MSFLSLVFYNNNVYYALLGSFVEIPWYSSMFFRYFISTVPDWQPRILLGMVEARFG